MTAKTTDPLVSPITTNELSDWLGGVSDPILPSLLLSATDAVIRFLGYDLTPRDWTLTLWDWPATGARTSPNLSPAPYRLQREINLPYAGVQSVQAVTSYGEPVAEYVARTQSLMLPAGVPREAFGDNDEPALVVEYTAGMAPVPPVISDAIKMLAAFLYEHRGECDVNDALARSGAAVMLQPYKRDAVVF